MKKYKLAVATLLVAGISRIAFAGANNHEYENLTHCKSDCTGSCTYSDCAACADHSGSCYAQGAGQAAGCYCN